MDWLNPGNPGFWQNTPEGQFVMAALLGQINPIIGYDISPYNPRKGAPLRSGVFRGSTPASLLDTRIHGLIMSDEDQRRIQGGGPV